MIPSKGDRFRQIANMLDLLDTQMGLLPDDALPVGYQRGDDMQVWLRSLARSMDEIDDALRVAK